MQCEIFHFAFMWLRQYHHLETVGKIVHNLMFSADVLFFSRWMFFSFFIRKLLFNWCSIRITCIVLLKCDDDNDGDAAREVRMCTCRSTEFEIFISIRLFPFFLFIRVVGHCDSMLYNEFNSNSTSLSSFRSKQMEKCYHVERKCNKKKLSTQTQTDRPTDTRTFPILRSMNSVQSFIRFSVFFMEKEKKIRQTDFMSVQHSHLIIATNILSFLSNAHSFYIFRRWCVVFFFSNFCSIFFFLINDRFF